MRNGLRPDEGRPGAAICVNRCRNCKLLASLWNHRLPKPSRSFSQITNDGHLLSCQTLGTDGWPQFVRQANALEPLPRVRPPRRGVG